MERKMREEEADRKKIESDRQKLQQLKKRELEM